MKVRIDSPFAKLTKDQAEELLAQSKVCTIDILVEVVKGAPEPIHCSPAAMRRYLRRVAAEKAVTDTENCEEAAGELAKKAETPVIRDAALVTMRQKMFEEACASDDRELMMKMFSTLNAERESDRAWMIEQRKIKIAEENAKLGWRKLECENARAGLKLLPTVLGILLDGKRGYEDRVKGAVRCLQKAGTAVEVGGSRELLAMPEEEKKAA